MKLLHEISNSKYKDYIISALVLSICTCILITIKIAENRTFKQYLSYNIGDITEHNSNYDESDQDSFEVFSYDQEYYDSFLGLPTDELFTHLESSFWEVLDNRDRYTTYQNGNGSTITIYYNELQIIEDVDIITD